MKWKATYISIHVIMILLMVFCYYKINSYEYQAANIVELHDAKMQAQHMLETSKDVSTIETLYNCKILLVNETGYTNELYHTMEDGWVIFDYLDKDTLEGKICFPPNVDSQRDMKASLLVTILLFIVVLIVLFNCVFWFYYIKIIRPFYILKRFAGNIARGDFDFPLSMTKDNYFGAFTESFDLMREELKIAKEGEYQANISKRELVASLSHDIKTPVASINALCEILEIKVTDEENHKKIVAIHQKSDMIDQLISNLFHATLEELQALKIEVSEQSSYLIYDFIHDLDHYGLLHFCNSVPECLIQADSLRLAQVIDNIINNSYKYAHTNIDITFSENMDFLTVEIRDYGQEVEEYELALVTEKFYRGKNASGKNGSGLGLYLAKQFMEGMNGTLLCEENHGFIVTLSFKKV